MTKRSEKISIFIDKQLKRHQFKERLDKKNNEDNKVTENRILKRNFKR